MATSATASCKAISAIRTMVNTLVGEVRPDAIVHFAAESHVDRSILSPEPVVRTNYNGTFTLLEAAGCTSVARFVHVSTDEVYGSLAAPAEADEQYPLNPSSPYSASKAASDLLARSYFVTFKLPVVITRASNNYGPFQFPEKLIPLMITNALEDRLAPGLRRRPCRSATGCSWRTTAAASSRSCARAAMVRSITSAATARCRTWKWCTRS